MRLARGFLRPVVKGRLEARESAAVAAICPALSVARPQGPAHRHPLWGPYIDIWTGHATDERLRHHASSGGVLSAVLIHLLETGKADYVVQVAASDASPLYNAVKESVGRDQIYRAAGSRYAPSAPLAFLHEQVERPGRFAFVGKPCDVGALRAWQRRDPRIAAKAPWLISFFCAGIPAQEGTSEILRRLGIGEEDVAEFRYRGDGWPGHAAARTRSGREARMTYHESWGRILSKRLQFRCKICPDGSGGSADFVCADAWYGDEKGYPVLSEAAGRSLVVSRTRKGDRLVREAARAGRIELSPCAVEEIARMQPAQARRNSLVLSRLAAMALLGRRRPRYRGLAWSVAPVSGRPPSCAAFWAWRAGSS
ncbi:MAG: Coenzyme F420 hydrogenase/dehydrogenase, beta subunit C-terminal domain [Alphaproteobacteria bacterium]